MISIDIKDCTLVVSSCDAYEDLWPAFFKILSIEWPNIECPIVLNTESKSYNYPGLDIRTFRMYHPGEKIPWSRRLRETLEKIESKYIIFMLDDFFLQGTVDTKRLKQCLDSMEQNNRIVSFCFMETFSSNVKDERYIQFERRPLIAPYKLNCQAALWKRTSFIKYLKKDENPWEWETMGNWRTYRYPRDIFYSQIPNGDYIFPYIYKANGINWGGLALYRGKWYLPYVEPLFKKHDIEMNFSVRGTVKDIDFVPSARKKKSDYTGIKRKLYWLIQIYIAIMALIHFLKNIKHFL